MATKKSLSRAGCGGATWGSGEESKAAPDSLSWQKEEDQQEGECFSCFSAGAILQLLIFSRLTVCLGAVSREFLPPSCKLCTWLDTKVLGCLHPPCIVSWGIIPWLISQSSWTPHCPQGDSDIRGVHGTACQLHCFNHGPNQLPLRASSFLSSQKNCDKKVDETCCVIKSRSLSGSHR